MLLPAPRVYGACPKREKESTRQLRHRNHAVLVERRAARERAAREGVWCRDSTGRFLPVMSQNATLFSLFSGLTLFLAFAVHWRSWRSPRPTWLCGSFFGWPKPGSQSLTHRKPVRTIEVALDRSESWQADLRRLPHLEVAGDEEAVVQ